MKQEDWAALENNETVKRRAGGRRRYNAERRRRGQGGKRQATAWALGIDRTALYKEMKKYGLLPPRTP